MATREQTKNMETLRRRVREVKALLGVSQTEIAELIGYSAQAVSDWMTGKAVCRKMPYALALLDRLEEEHNAKTRH